MCLTNGDCRVDGDCASGQRCALSLPFLLGSFYDGIETGAEIVPRHPTSSFDEVLGYFCTTPDDRCTGGNMPAPECGGAISGVCTYDMDAGHWAWGYAP